MSAPNRLIGFGLMGLSWKQTPVSDDQAFAAMRAAVERGATQWSTSGVYGPWGDPLHNLHLIRRYFDRYPEDIDKVSLYVKSCFDVTTFTPDCSPETIRSSYEVIQAALGPHKKVDYFGFARRDKATPLKVSLAAAKTLIDAGKIKGVFMSEVGAHTIQEAASILPISAVEVEFSVWSPDLLRNGVGRAAKENNIPILAYSPLGAGFLTGSLRTKDDIPAGDVRNYLDRFNDENFAKNIELADAIVKFAESRHATPAQVALAWIYEKQKQGLVGQVIPIPGASTAARVQENTTFIELTSDDVDQLEKLMPHTKVAGVRASSAAEHLLWA